MMTLASKRKYDEQIVELNKQLAAEKEAFVQLNSEFEKLKAELTEAKSKPAVEDPRIAELTAKLAEAEKANVELASKLKDVDSKASEIAHQIMGSAGTSPVGVESPNARWLDKLAEQPESQRFAFYQQNENKIRAELLTVNLATK